MATIYVYDNALLGDDGEDFKAALCDQHTAGTAQECLDWADENYDSNDYTTSFAAP